MTVALTDTCPNYGLNTQMASTHQNDPAFHLLMDFKHCLESTVAGLLTYDEKALLFEHFKQFLVAWSKELRAAQKAGLASRASEASGASSGDDDNMPVHNSTVAKLLAHKHLVKDKFKTAWIATIEGAETEAERAYVQTIIDLC